MTEIQETGICWDHDTGEISISTRRRGLASKLRRMGFEPLRDEGPGGYANFKVSEDAVLVSIRLRQKGKLTANHLKRLREGRERKRGVRA